MYAPEQNRREFLQCSALGLAGLAMHTRSRPEQRIPARTHEQQGVANRYWLSLDGTAAGFLRSVEGGSIYADVITEAPDSSGVPGKRLGPVQYEPLAMQFDFSIGGSVFDWIATSWRKDQRWRNGAVVAVNDRGQAVSQLEFVNALLVETTIPAMDAASKDPGSFTIKLQPESTRTRNSSGSISSPGAKTTRPWFANGFRLEIDGLDATNVRRIESFTVKQSVVADTAGGHDAAKEHTMLPTTLEFPNLAVQLPQASAGTWVAWHDNFVVKGHHQASEEKTGRLTFLSPDLGTELAEVGLFGLGIYRLSDVAGSSDGAGGAARNSVAQLRAELYCERMEFSFNVAAVG